VHIYYLIDYPLTEVGESLEYGKKIFKSTVDEAEVVFKNAPFDYLYLAGEDYYKGRNFCEGSSANCGYHGESESMETSL
jgi:hypothetical protein